MPTSDTEIVRRPALKGAIAAADRDAYIADPRKSRAPLSRLITKDYTAERRKLIDPRRTPSTVTRVFPKAVTRFILLLSIESATSFRSSTAFSEKLRLGPGRAVATGYGEAGESRRCPASVRLGPSRAIVSRWGRCDIRKDGQKATVRFRPVPVRP